MSTNNQLEAVQPAARADGNGLILFVPTVADPFKPKLSELTASGVEKITYGLAPDGFDHQTSVSTITSGRYTLLQALESDGKITDTVEVKYVWENKTPVTGVRKVLAPGTTGFIVKRMGIDNAEALKAQQVVTVIPVRCGIQRDVPPAENSDLYKIQKLNVIGTVARDVPIVAP